MTSHFAHGFADELVKVARLKGVKKFIDRLKKSKDLRASIKKSALLGGGTGAATGLLSRDDKPALRRVLGGAALGAVGGGITGAVFPGWFSRSNMLAADETLRRTAR